MYGEATGRQWAGDWIVHYALVHELKTANP